MVLYATLSTNIRKIQPDKEVDLLHGIKYESSRLTKVNGASEYTLDTSTGLVSPGNIQIPERPILRALLGDLNLEDKKFSVGMIPDGYDNYPFMFELERLAKYEVRIEGIDSISREGTSLVGKDEDYFLEQEAALEEFSRGYASMVTNSAFGKPAMEAYYKGIIESNSSYIERANHPERIQWAREAMLRQVIKEDKLEKIFGREAYSNFKSQFGTPRIE